MTTQPKAYFVGGGIGSLAGTAFDRPLPVPPGTWNFAFISQFVELPEDVVFTVEYSIRAAVYQRAGNRAGHCTCTLAACQV